MLCVLCACVVCVCCVCLQGWSVRVVCLVYVSLCVVLCVRYVYYFVILGAARQKVNFRPPRLDPLLCSGCRCRYPQDQSSL